MRLFIGSILVGEEDLSQKIAPPPIPMGIFFPQEKATKFIQKRDSRRVSVSTLHFDRGLQHLSESDPVLRIVIQHLQPQPPEPREANFESLIRIIAG